MAFAARIALASLARGLAIIERQLAVEREHVQIGESGPFARCGHSSAQCSSICLNVISSTSQPT
jgi:hypothetical protein